MNKNKIKNNNYKLCLVVIKLLVVFILGKFFYETDYNLKYIKLIQPYKRIGVLCYTNDNNIGNNLVKFSMYTLLKSYGFHPTMIAPSDPYNLYFLKNKMKYKEIKSNFNEIKENDYDILMVNSDQTWRYNFEYLLDIGFLNFAQNWSIPKFTYGVSLAVDSWDVSKTFLDKAKILVKKFSAISVREQNSVKIIQNKLGIEPIFVLDPTFLINKNIYLELIKDFKLNINLNQSYICVYKLDPNKIIEDFINDVAIKFNYKILYIDRFKENYVEKFLFIFNISKAIITDSYHGTVFSIIFNKPFISFINSFRGKDRFFSLAETFNLKNRFIFPTNSNIIDLNLLKTNPNINQTEFNALKEKSLNYIKKNLGMK